MVYEWRWEGREVPKGIRTLSLEKGLAKSVDLTTMPFYQPHQALPLCTPSH